MALEARTLEGRSSARLKTVAEESGAETAELVTVARLGDCVGRLASVGGATFVFSAVGGTGGSEAEVVAPAFSGAGRFLTGACRSRASSPTSFLGFGIGALLATTFSGFTLVRGAEGLAGFVFVTTLAGAGFLLVTTLAWSCFWVLFDFEVLAGLAATSGAGFLGATGAGRGFAAGAVDSGRGYLAGGGGV